MCFRFQFVCLILIVSTPAFVSDTLGQEPTTNVAAAMRTMFSPLEVPKRKTMGLLQRNFLDAAGLGGDLEVAIVVDGTDSMAAELDGVRQSVQRMIDDLRRLRGGQVRVAIVVYRDTGSPSGEVETPLATFSSDEKEIESAVSRLTPESGAPYYHELLDVGVHQAITKLDWSDDPTVSKWIMLFGDAPPYELSYNDEAFPGARRRFADELLVSLATQRGIAIHCILCDSTPETEKPHEESVAQTRRVMDRLAADTGGMMLDLSYPVIREALAGKSREPLIEFTPIAPITGEDLAVKSLPIDGPTMRIAFLPHEPIDQMKFDPSSRPVQIATALVDKFRQLPGIRVKSPLEVERQVRRLRAEGLDGSDAIRGLAGRLRVDYVVWGRAEPENAMTSVAFRQRDGRPIVRVSFAGSPDGLAKVVLNAAAAVPDQDPDLARFAKRVLEGADRAYLDQPLSTNVSTTTDLLTAIASLEQSLGTEIGDEVSRRLLDRAGAAVATAIDAEPANPIANWVLANVLFNQASADYRAGNQDEASKKMTRSRSALRSANQNLSQVKSVPLRTEIEADFRLISRKEFAEAMKLYESMTKDNMPPDTRRRGHWMLSGLTAGDWGVPPELVDASKSRTHVVEMLRQWPDSPESERLKAWLRWDESRETTTHNHIPRLSDVLGNLGE